MELVRGRERESTVERDTLLRTSESEVAEGQFTLSKLVTLPCLHIMKVHHGVNNDRPISFR